MAASSKHLIDFEPRAFAISVQPVPGEGLADIVFRACAENGFHDLWIINRLLGKRDIKQGWGHSRFARSNIDVRALAQILGVPNGVADIERLMYRKGARGVRFFGVEISGNELIAARRVSPLSLRQKPYAKAIWSIRSLSFDPHTMEQLLDHCPECGSLLQYRFSIDVFRCPCCRIADFRDYPQPIIEVPDLESLDFVTSLIDPENTREYTIREGLRNFGKGELFTLATTLARVIDTENSEGRIRPSATAASLSIAGGAIMGWPSKFAEVVETYSFNKNPDRNHTIDNSLYGVSRELRKVVRKELATALSNRTRHYAIGTGERGASTQVQFWSSPTIIEQAKTLGLPIIEVLALYTDGVIKCPDKRYAQVLGLSCAATPLDLAKFDRLDGDEMGSVSMLDAVFGSKSSRHPWTRIMGKILTRNVHVRLRTPLNVNFLKRAYVSDIDSIRSICEGENSNVDPKSTVNVREAVFYLRLGSAAIAILKQEGFFASSKISMEEIWQFQERFISASEIKARLVLAGVKPPPLPQIGLGLQALGAKPILLDFPRYHRDDGEGYLSTILSERQHLA